MVQLRRLTVGFAAALTSLTAGPAWSFDGLMAMAEQLPVSSRSMSELYFMSPAAVAGWQPSEIPGVGLADLALVLFDADLGVARVGITFPELEGIAHFGTAPHATLHLLGDNIRTDAVGEALLERDGMAETDRLGVTVFAEGEDNTVDIMARDPAYPFGGGWRGHRVAVWDGGAIVAYSWGDLEAALAAAQRMEEPAPSGQIWSLADLVAAAAGNAPANATAFAATGLPVFAFDAEESVTTGNGAIVPGFEYALYIASTAGATETVQMVLAYRQATNAEAAANAVKARLTADIGERYPVETIVLGRTVDLPDGATLAVISVVYPPGTAGHPSSYEIGRWTNDVLSRRHDILAIAP